jgi:cytochrome b subunit of formate dehydrogenase
MYKKFLPLFLLFTSFIAYSQSNKECIECHSDKSITMEKNGKTVSLYINSDEFSKSSHKDQNCVDCHIDFNAGDIPHKSKMEKVNCLSCHESRGLEKSVHNKNIDCSSCHGKHNIRDAKNLYRNVDACLKCHSQSNITGFKSSKHFTIKDPKRIVSCNNCHGTIHTLLSRDNSNSLVNKSKVFNLCIKCHNLNNLTAVSGLHKNIMAGSDNDSKRCTNCHNAHSITLGKTSACSKGCISCHLNKEWFKDKYYGDNNLPLTALVEKYSGSIHARLNQNGKEFASCNDCHGNHINNPKIDPREATKPENQPATCGKCHKFAEQEFRNSNHGKALINVVKGSPSCSNCHGEHDIKSISDSSSLASRAQEVKVCLKCHLNNPDVQKIVNPSAKFIESYEKSVHGIAYHKGDTKAAICSDCHGSHRIIKAGDPKSSVNINQIPKTCAKCHEGVSKEYLESVHGAAFLKGNKDIPTCTYCHGEHQILTVNDPLASTASANVSAKICAVCHNSISLNSKFDLSGKKFSSYQDSYHGLATTSGDAKAANCASCHGIHNIKPSNDPNSTINKSHLVKTCGKCHPGANENFIKGSIHINPTDNDNGLLYFIATSYVLLIIVIVGGMFLHNIIDFVRKSRSKFRKRRFQEAGHKFGSALYLRMSVEERVQHLCLMISFILLSVTGFMLKFPNAWWVIPIRNLSESFFEIRGLVHRVAAVVLVTSSFYHIYYVFFTARGKGLIKDLLPKIKDVHDAIGIMKFNLGISKVKPKLDRFSYIEKAEYWALIWGTVVMAVTGILLWFENYFLGLTSKLFLDVATTIHYYEAWLATLAIIVWHFYFVIFNPEIYPMNLAWIRGTLTEEEMSEEHPLELERIKKRASNDIEPEDKEQNMNIK